jgi:hypothetical protein
MKKAVVCSCFVLVALVIGGLQSASASRTAQLQRVFLPFIQTEARFEWSYETVSEGGQFPSLALDATGQPHVAFVGADGSLQYARRDGTTWNVMTVDAGTETNQPVLRFDPAGCPHIAYVRGGTLKYASLTGSTWMTETLGTTTHIEVDLAFNAEGVPYVANGAVYMHQDEDDWVIGALPDERSGDTQIVFGTDGTLHVAYKTYDETTMTIVVDHATYNGTWTVERATNYANYNIDFALDTSNIPHIVTTSTCGKCPITAYYVTKVGSIWTSTLFGGYYLQPSTLALAVDSEAAPHIAYTTYTNPSRAYYTELRDGEEAALPFLTDQQPNDISLALTADDMPLVSYSLTDGRLIFATLVDNTAP